MFILREAGVAGILTVNLFRVPICRQRETSMVKGQEALAAGESGAAAQHFAKATAVTHQMAYELIKVTDNAFWRSRRWHFCVCNIFLFLSFRFLRLVFLMAGLPQGAWPQATLLLTMFELLAGTVMYAYRPSSTSITQSPHYCHFGTVRIFVDEHKNELPRDSSNKM